MIVSNVKVPWFKETAADKRNARHTSSANIRICFRYFPERLPYVTDDNKPIVPVKVSSKEPQANPETCNE